MLSISTLIVTGFILYPAFFLLSSFRRFFPSLQIRCLFFFCPSVRNFAIIAAFPRSSMLLCSPDFGKIELFVNENNPQTLNALIKRLKSFYKDKPEVDPYKMAYGLMPSQAASCPDAKQMYINGYFCYADKFGILTNGLGIVRDIVFFDDDFKAAHPELPVEKNRIPRTRIKPSVTLPL